MLKIPFAITPASAEDLDKTVTANFESLVDIFFKRLTLDSVRLTKLLIILTDSVTSFNIGSADFLTNSAVWFINVKSFEKSNKTFTINTPTTIKKTTLV